MTKKIDIDKLKSLEIRLNSEPELLGQFMADPVRTLAAAGVDITASAARALARDLRAVREVAVGVLGAQLGDASVAAKRFWKRKMYAKEVPAEASRRSRSPKRQTKRKRTT